MVSEMVWLGMIFTCSLNYYFFCVILQAVGIPIKLNNDKFFVVKVVTTKGMQHLYSDFRAIVNTAKTLLNHLVRF